MNMSINERLSLQWSKQQKKKKRKKKVRRENESSWCTSAVPLFQNNYVNCVIKAILWYSAFTHKNEHTPDTYIK